MKGTTGAGRPLDVHTIVPSGTIGRDLHYYPEIGSTNDVFAALSAESWGHGSVVMADHQTQGRGRQGRRWVAPPFSSLLLSVALHWPAGIPLGQATMLCALAVDDALAEQTGLQPSIKWPNDILLEGGKVAGILCQTRKKGEEVFVVAGIGINVNVDPVAGTLGDARATSVRHVLGKTVSREELAGHLFARVDLWYRVLTDDPTALFLAWSRRLSTVGTSVTVDDMTGRWQGTATGVRPDGGLVILTDGGQTRTVYAADVSVRSVGRDFTSE